jgi:hypothetical protein
MERRDEDMRRLMKQTFDNTKRPTFNCARREP